MLLIITILILFVYTVVLIVFFMGWCTLVPTMCHPRREIPFCAVKSPRRNTKYIDLESISSSVSLDYLHRVIESSDELERKYSVLSAKPPPLNDYLHPKYSLPPIEIDVEEEKTYFEFLRTPAEIASKRTSVVKLSVSKTPKAIDDSVEKII
uniref:Uncharacterized protein n=1 Tax=Parascaris univalens TaxID=6257 RepID=A0A915C7E1_PARUN